jgi:WD40 repeat protein
MMFMYKGGSELDRFVAVIPAPNYFTRPLLMAAPTAQVKDSFPEILLANAGRIAQTGEIRFSPRDLVMAISWSPNGESFAVSSGEYIYWYDALAKREMNRFHLGALTHSITFSPDGRWFAAGSRDGYLRVWKAEITEEVGGFHPVLEIPAPKKGVTSVAFSPDSRVLASGGNDAVARLWDPATGKLSGLMIGGSFAVPAIAFTPDGLALAVVNGGVIRLRQVGSERIVGTIRSENPLFSLAISPDGRVLAAGDLENLVHLWDPTQAFHTGQEYYPESMKLMGHKGNNASYRAMIWKVVFSPNGQLLASAGGDGTIRLWDVINGDLVTTLEGHKAGVTGVAFQPDGRLLASCGLDSTVRFWGVVE